MLRHGQLQERKNSPNGAPHGAGLRLQHPTLVGQFRKRHVRSGGQWVTGANDHAEVLSGQRLDPQVVAVLEACQPTDHDINIADDGTITAQEGAGRTDSPRGKLRLVSFPEAQKLLKEGANLYAAGEGSAPQPDAKSMVHQGFIEKSNVNGVAEMSRMIEVTRAYTQMSTLLQQESDLHKTAIEKLAEVPS